MDIHEAMRTTFAAREFTDEPLPDDVLFDILDRARFAPSGGNRQGWHVIVVRDRATREALAALATPAAKRYTAQREAGENPWNPVDPTSVDAATAERTPPMRRLIEPVLKAAVVLVVCVDLKVVACLDQYLDRVGLIGGASVYPFAWNILLAARAHGFGGTITTLAVAEEPRIKARLGLPVHVAVCAVVPLGRPVKQLARLRRKAVPQFAHRASWGGAAFTGAGGADRRRLHAAHGRAAPARWPAAPVRAPPAPRPRRPRRDAARSPPAGACRRPAAPGRRRGRRGVLPARLSRRASRAPPPRGP